MKLFWKYILGHRKIIAAFLLFIIAFAASFYLYHLPFEAVIYPTLICAVIAAVFIAVDFIGVRRDHRMLSEIKKLSAAMIDILPEVKNVSDEDYQAVIRALQNEINELNAHFSAKYNDMTEYYTVWVHQIKTPITSMRLSLENEDTALSRKLSYDLFQIEQYVEMVLAFLRLNSDASDYVFKEYPLDDMIEQSVSKFASEFIARKIELDYIPARTNIITDDKWMMFVMEQILSNALKYTKSGRIKIYLQEPETLCIEDTGIGISASDLPRVFEKGYTGCNGRRDKRASGIGLYLCKRICDKLGIGISISSEPDKGTKVMLDLEQYDLKKQ